MTNYMDYCIKAFEKEHIGQATELLRAAYESERAAVGILPEYDEMPDLTRALIYFSENSMGVSAVKDDRLIGFLCAYQPYAHAYNSPTDSSCRSPLHAHAVADTTDIRLWSFMYREAGRIWTGAGAKYHSVTFYRHDTEAIGVFSGYSFGYRFTDSVRRATPLGVSVPKGFCVRKLVPDDFPAMRPLRAALSGHLAASPSFLISTDEIIEKYIAGKEANEGLITFGLFNNDELAGFIDAEADGENFISCSGKMLNIQGMYLIPSLRGRGLAELLLEAVINEAAAQGYGLIGVDYETLNPNAVGFWEKYFNPYTLSVVRRLD